MIKFEDGKPTLNYKDENGTQQKIQLLEVQLTDNSTSTFERVRESLQRIGIANEYKKELYPSCHILSEGNRHYITHFKEMFALIGRQVDLCEVDLLRRNYVAGLLQEWKLVNVCDPSLAASCRAMVASKEMGVSASVLPFKSKAEWKICPKFNMSVFLFWRKEQRKAKNKKAA